MYINEYGNWIGRMEALPNEVPALKSQLNSLTGYHAFPSKDYDSTLLFNQLSQFSSTFDYEKVIFNDPATIVIWSDGTKTVVKCKPEDVFDPEKGLALCFMKKALGNKGSFNEVLKKEVTKYQEERKTIENYIREMADTLSTSWQTILERMTMGGKLDEQLENP